jgi:hypothetical protein
MSTGTEWTPPKCTFVEGKDVFLEEASFRLARRNVGHYRLEDNIYVYPADLKAKLYVQKARALFQITPVGIAGGRCRIEFTLRQGDWAAVRPIIEQLIEDLCEDDFIDVGSSAAKKSGAETAPPSGNSTQDGHIQVSRPPRRYNEQTRKAATVAHYLIIQYEKGKEAACGLAGIDEKTYKRCLEDEKLFTPEDFCRRFQVSLAEAADEVDGRR